MLITPATTTSGSFYFRMKHGTARHGTTRWVGPWGLQPDMNSIQLFIVPSRVSKVVRPICPVQHDEWRA